MVSSTMVCWTVARREDVPASGRRENAILPSGHDSSLENAGDAMAVAAATAVTAAVVDCSSVAAVAVAGERSGMEDAMAVDIAANLERKFLLVSLLLLLLLLWLLLVSVDVDSCSGDSLLYFVANITCRDLLGSFLSVVIVEIVLVLVEILLW